MEKNYKSRYTGAQIDANLAKGASSVQGVRVNGELKPKDASGVVDLGNIEADGAVRYDREQSLPKEEKEQARDNIGAVDALYVQQSVGAESEQRKDEARRLENKIDDFYNDAHNEIVAEQERATAAEDDLSERIDAIVQGKDVRDIVGTYAELMEYDTDTLGDNDIVMVLLDETKSGHTTYYRWHVGFPGSWEFIGGLAFTYTKTEIDEKFRALHIVLPVIPASAVEHPEEYQELLAQVDTMVRSAGADASFKMPVSVVADINGNVDITFVKSNPAHLYLGIFADDMSKLYHITRTTSTPRTYTLAIVENVFVTDSAVVHNTGDETIAGKKTFTGQAIVRHKARLQDGFSIENKDDFPNEDGVGVTFNKRTRPDESMADVVSFSGVGDSVVLEGVETPMRSSDAANKGYVDGKVGDLSQLQTTEKSNLVDAINEVKQGGGDDEMQRILAAQSPNVVWEDFDGKIHIAYGTTLNRFAMNNADYRANCKRILAGSVGNSTDFVYSVGYDSACSVEELFPHLIITNKVTSMTNAFSNTSLTKIDTRGWDTSNVISMSGLFAGYAERPSRIKEIDLTNIDVSKASTLQSVCAYLVEIESLDFRTWKLVSDVMVRYLCFGCLNLTTLGLMSIPASINGLDSAFLGCVKLQNILMNDDALIQASINFTESALLTTESVQTLIDHLDVENVGTLKLNAQAKSRYDAQYGAGACATAVTAKGWSLA